MGAQFPPEWKDPDNFDAMEAEPDEPGSGMGEVIQNGPVLLVILYDPDEAGASIRE